VATPIQVPWLSKVGRLEARREFADAQSLRDCEDEYSLLTSSLVLFPVQIAARVMPQHGNLPSAQGNVLILPHSRHDG
jgi:hypothetical protein